MSLVSLIVRHSEARARDSSGRQLARGGHAAHPPHQHGRHHRVDQWSRHTTSARWHPREGRPHRNRCARGSAVRQSVRMRRRRQEAMAHQREWLRAGHPSRRSGPALQNREPARGCSARPSRKKSSDGTSSSASFVSCIKSKSGCTRPSHQRTFSSRALSELTFQVAMRMAADIQQRPERRRSRRQHSHRTRCSFCTRSLLEGGFWGRSSFCTALSG